MQFGLQLKWCLYVGFLFHLFLSIVVVIFDKLTIIYFEHIGVADKLCVLCNTIISDADWFHFWSISCKTQAGLNHPNNPHNGFTLFFLLLLLRMCVCFAEFYDENRWVHSTLFSCVLILVLSLDLSFSCNGWFPHTKAFSFHLMYQCKLFTIHTCVNIHIMPLLLLLYKYNSPKYQIAVRNLLLWCNTEIQFVNRIYDGLESNVYLFHNVIEMNWIKFEGHARNS